LSCLFSALASEYVMKPFFPFVLSLFSFTLSPAQNFVILPGMAVTELSDSVLTLVSEDQILADLTANDSLHLFLTAFKEPDEFLKREKISVPGQIGSNNFLSKKEIELNWPKTEPQVQIKLTKQLSASEKNYSTFQNIWASKSDFGISALDFFSVRVIENKEFTFFRDLYDFAEDSLLFRVFFKPTTTESGKITLLIRLSMGEDVVKAKKMLLSYSAGVSQFKLPLGKFPKEIESGGRLSFSAEGYDQNKNLVFSFDQISIFVKGVPKKGERSGNTEDPYFLAAYTDPELENFGEISLLFANSTERSLYKGLNSQTGKRKFLTAFWQKREQPEEKYLPNFDLLQLRMKMAAGMKLEYLGTKYWNTDRGRVILQYGIPDEIEKMPFGQSNYPVQSWTYNDIEEGVSFFFIDYQRNGVYRLVHSTKRGEIYNPDFNSTRENTDVLQQR